MNTLVSLLVWLSVFHQTRLQRDQDADFDMHTFKEAIRQAYNDSMSFSQNFYELLALICPESVYCQTNGTFNTDDADFRRNLAQEETSVPEGLLQNYDHVANAEARIFLQRNAHHLPAEISDRTPKTSFSVLLTGDRSLSVQPEVTSKDNTLCSCAEKFDTSKKRCREILCPPGEIRNVCECVPFISNITGMRIKLDLEINLQLQYTVAEERFRGALQTNAPSAITKAMRKLIASQFGPLTSDYQFLFRQGASMGERFPTFHYCETLTLNGVHDDREGVENMFTTLHAGLTKKIVGTQMKISLGRITDLDSISSGIIPDPKVDSEVELELLYPGRDDFLSKKGRRNRPTSQPLKKLVYCKRIKLDEDEEECLYNVTAALGWPRAYLEYVYWQEDGSMCIEDFEEAFMQGNSSGTYSYTYPTNGYWVILVSALGIPCILIAICLGLERLTRKRLTEQSSETEMNEIQNETSFATRISQP